MQNDEQTAHQPAENSNDLTGGYTGPNPPSSSHGA